MKVTRFTHMLMALTVTLSAWAQGPNGSGTYYQNANALKGEALKTALSKIISTGAKDLGYDALWNAYKTTDLRPDGTIWDIYSNVTKYDPVNDHKGNYKQEGDVFNREHTTPQSWFKKASPMKSDLFHVFPTDGYVNNRRSNFPLGETKGENYQSKNGFSKVGKCTTEGYNGTVFEPADEYKGDLARVYFYMATRYEDRVSSWGGDTYGKSSYPGLAQWALNMFIRWAGNDPVSQKEVDRNNAVYKLQMNRNPYVDYPGLEQYVWGTLADKAFDYANYTAPGENKKPDNPDEPNNPDQPNKPDEPNTPGTSDNNSAMPTGKVVFKKVMSVNDLLPGGYYLIVNEKATAALGATNKGYRTSVTVPMSRFEMTAEVNGNDQPRTLTLGGKQGSYTLYDGIEKTYLAYNGTKNTLNNEKDAQSASAQWDIDVVNDTIVRITNKQNTDRIIYYNAHQPRFACYKSSSAQQIVQLFVANVTTNIVNLPQAETLNVNVYAIDGRLIRANVEKEKALLGLPKGIYVVGKKKYVVR